MDTTIWAKLRDDPRLSWHVISGDYTRCGRRRPEPGATADNLSVLAKTCESCMKWTLRDQERADA